MNSAWRLSIKRTEEMIETVKAIAEKDPKTKAIHIVLTVKNCKLELINKKAGFRRTGESGPD